MTRVSLIISSFFVLFVSLFLLVDYSYAQSPARINSSDIVVFVRNGCPHCKAEESFLTKLQSEQKDLKITFYRLDKAGDKEIWKQFTDRRGIAKVTPITIIGKKYFVGYGEETISGKEIRSLLKTKKQKNENTDISSGDISESGEQTSTCPDDTTIPCTVSGKKPYFVSLPFLGTIDTQKYPLVILSSALGFIDGFNPCAMWVLITFLVILMQIGNRKKMFVFAGVFILAEAIMYSLILTVWYKTWDFVQLDAIVTPIIGIISIGGGVMFIREWRKKELACKVTNLKERSRTRDRIEQLASSKFTIITLLGILGVAFSVNIIEFACSIGIPQAFTKIMEINHLSLLHSGFLIAIYIFFYMLDDLVVFGIALYGIDKLALATKYSKLSNLIGGIIMIILGVLLIFKLQLLIF